MARLRAGGQMEKSQSLLKSVKSTNNEKTLLRTANSVSVVFVETVLTS